MLLLLSAGAALSLGLGMILSSSTWELTSLLLAKGIAVTNFVALLGLFVQRKGYRRMLSLRKNDDMMYYWSFVACACLFFGLFETVAAAFLAMSFQQLSKPLRPFTGLQMFSQLPEASAVFALGSLFSCFSFLPVVVLQQLFVLRLMCGGGLGKLRGNCKPKTLVLFFVFLKKEKQQNQGHRVRLCSITIGLSRFPIS
jgi:hypothetical protein